MPADGALVGVDEAPGHGVHGPRALVGREQVTDSSELRCGSLRPRATLDGLDGAWLDLLEEGTLLLHWPSFFRGLDLDESAAADLELQPRPEPPFDLDDLDDLIQQPDLLPPGFAARPLGDREYAWSQPGLPAPLRVTTRADYFEQHPESTELWSPGSPLFPRPDVIATVEEVVAAGEQWKAVVR